MFPRIRNGRVLECEVRARAYATVRAKPGVTIAEIARTIGVDFRTAEYHLRVLRELHLVEGLCLGSRRHFFQNGGTFSRERQEALALLRLPARRRICAHLDRNPGAGIRQLAPHTGLGRSTVHHHIRLLRRAGLLKAQVSRRRPAVPMIPPPSPGGLQTAPPSKPPRGPPGAPPVDDVVPGPKEVVA